MNTITTAMATIVQSTPGESGSVLPGTSRRKMSIAYTPFIRYYAIIGYGLFQFRPDAIFLQKYVFSAGMYFSRTIPSN